MKNSAKKSSSVKKVLKKIKPYSFYLILALVSAIISVSLTLYIPVLTGNAIDNIIDKGNVDFASVIQILVYIGVGIGGVALFQWIMTYFTNIVSYRTVRDLRREVSLNIKRLMEIGSYRGIRHRRGLPVRGQNTKTNARTRKGPKKTIANKKK